LKENRDILGGFDKRRVKPCCTDELLRLDEESGAKAVISLNRDRVADVFFLGINRHRHGG
jgi:hypothetical protein